MNKALKFLGFVALAVLVGATAAVAGSLGPSSAPANTMYTLSDVYELVTTGTTTASSGFSTPGSVSASMYSLSQIVDAFASSTRHLAAENIVSGATIFGIAGSASAGAPTLEWDSVASSSHPRLCYDENENDGDCTDTGEGMNGGLLNQNGYVLGNVEYCQFLENDGLTLANSPQNLWRLPTVAEITDRMRTNPTEFNYDGGRPYRTSDLDVNDYSGQGFDSNGPRATYAAQIYSTDYFEVTIYDKSYGLVRTRCVREV